MNRQPYPTDLTDAEWQKIEPLLPPASRRGRPREHSLREIVNAIFYVVNNGTKWRALPHDLPPWQSVYYYFRLWTKQGRWEGLNTTLRERVRRKVGRHPQPSAAVLDSQSVKTTEEAAPETCGFDAGKRVKGRKRHLLVDSLGLPIKVIVLNASVQDRDGAQMLFSQVRPALNRLQKVWADAIYAGPQLEEWVKAKCHWVLEIVKRTDEMKGFVVLPKRWLVERSFSWLGRHRRLSKDYERLPETSEAFVYIAAIRLMTRRLASA
ncbi:MAG TPA: IS5 family transposase [Anaerolineales bacterium]|nr:IS5 family transposase [Anaerolineales bacterium]